jgi:hypothetical protein
MPLAAKRFAFNFSARIADNRNDFPKCPVKSHPLNWTRASAGLHLLGLKDVLKTRLRMADLARFGNVGRKKVWKSARKAEFVQVALVFCE